MSSIPPSSKGKDKADSRVPLLSDERDLSIDYGSTSQEDETTQHSRDQSPRARHVVVVWKSYLLTGTLTLLSTLFMIAFGIVLLADSYAAPAMRNLEGALSSGTNESGGAFWQSATIVRGPDNIKVLGLQKTTVGGHETVEANLTMTIRMAVDTDFVMGFRGVGDDTWFKRKWKQIGRWGVRRLGGLTAVVDALELYASNSSLSVSPLVVVKPHEPIPLPLYPGLTELDHNHPPSSLQAITITFSAYPSSNSTLILDFVKEAWLTNLASIKVHAPNLAVHGGGPTSVSATWWRFNLWRQWVKYSAADIVSFLKVKIPPLKFPGKPGSDHDLPKLSDLLVLESFLLTSSGAQSERNVSSSVSLTALASIPHPFPSLASKFDFEKGSIILPFLVSLPSPLPTDEKDSEPVALPVVSVVASPEFNATHVRIDILGHVLPLSGSDALSHAISEFVSNFLSYHPSPIIVSSPLYPSLEITAQFPPPSHKLDILRDVRMEDMSIHPGLGWATWPIHASDVGLFDILASATVYARIVLPEGIAIDITVKRAWIDCMVFDGPVSSDVLSTGLHYLPSSTTPVEKPDEPPVPRPSPLPSPLPPRAFARLTPRSWLNTTSPLAPMQLQVQSSLTTSMLKDGRSVYIKAKVVDVPLEVLPGRQSELSDFVTKVIFSSDPVIAGIRGVAAVGVTVPGLTGSSTGSGTPRVEGSELILTGIPFEGNVRVGGHKFGG